MQQRISLTARLIWFSFSVKLLKGPRKVFNYLRESGTSTLLREIGPEKIPPQLQKKILLVPWKKKVEGRFTSSPILRVPIQASPRGGHSRLSSIFYLKFFKFYVSDQSLNFPEKLKHFFISLTTLKFQNQNVQKYKFSFGNKNKDIQN